MWTYTEKIIMAILFMSSTSIITYTMVYIWNLKTLFIQKYGIKATISICVLTQRALTNKLRIEKLSRL